MSEPDNYFCDKKIKPGIYQHYKGKNYQVLGVGHHSETHEPLVIYRSLYFTPDFGENALWVRPYNQFIEIIEKNGKKLPRYRYIGKNHPV